MRAIGASHTACKDSRAYHLFDKRADAHCCVGDEGGFSLHWLVAFHWDRVSVRVGVYIDKRLCQPFSRVSGNVPSAKMSFDEIFDLTAGWSAFFTFSIYYEHIHGLQAHK